MSKTYRYYDLSFIADDETDILFEVKFISDGNTGQTAVNIPGSNDPLIPGSGPAQLGKAKDLRSATTISSSSISNPVPEEDEIIIDYYINGQLIQRHQNAKAEEKNPLIILYIDFPKP